MDRLCVMGCVIVMSMGVVLFDFGLFGWTLVLRVLLVGVVVLWVWLVFGGMLVW